MTATIIPAGDGQLSQRLAHAYLSDLSNSDMRFTAALVPSYALDRKGADHVALAGLAPSWRTRTVAPRVHQAAKGA